MLYRASATHLQLSQRYTSLTQKRPQRHGTVDAGPKDFAKVHSWAGEIVRFQRQKKMLLADEHWPSGMLSMTTEYD